MSFEPRDYLSHILGEADFLLRQSSRLTGDHFRSNETLQRSFVRSLEIIGEAAKKLLWVFARSIPTSSGGGSPECETV